ncbi:methyltransferase domain-containing protein [Ruegeria sp. Ofav3-42]|uniref:methyltransferase domain-containing protein n=1 Tax=Ruegeria sp. Ofav3-42 TaxID=2917759 RepID=UPI001EF5B8C5|nr:methyltransferase domain-containing protein [Ruegeria sp. Ofav3-42]MCG7522174.1 methyltransferase domain-containing protein [Ruegeria sp. Ofav3-42]
MNAQLAERVQRSFSRSFRSYHDSASQQSQIANHLVHEMRTGGAPQHFAFGLEFGCGTGHLTQRLCETFEFRSLMINDLSPEAEQTAYAVGADFLCGDAETLNWPGQPNLIASASMIQWLRDPAAFLRKAATALTPGGWLAVSGFGPEQYRELVKVGSTAKAPGLCRSEDLAAAVRDELEIISTGDTIREMHFASPRKVLEHLRRTGVNGRAQKGWTKTSLNQFTDQYVRYFGSETGVSLTYQPTWIVARKRD